MCALLIAGLVVWTKNKLELLDPTDWNRVLLGGSSTLN